MNGQILWYQRETRFPDYCPVCLGLNLVWCVGTLGQQNDDPLCVYRDKKGVQYLTGKAVTEYFRFVVRLVMLNISDEELSLISTHSIRVKACVLFAEAGRNGWYIKLRLRWMSDCYEVYLRNTKLITAQHSDAMSDVHERMLALAISFVNLPGSIDQYGVHDDTMYVLEDED